MPKFKSHFLTNLAVILVLTVAIATGSFSSVYANGRVQEFDKRVAGPYEVEVGKIPSTPGVGALHLTIRVTETATGASMIGADVAVTGVGPDSTAVEIGPLIATSDLQDPTFYDVAMHVDRIGTWVFTVAVSTERGNGTADFPMQVTEGSSITAVVTGIALVAFVSVLALAARSFLRERSKGKRRNT